MARRSKNIRLYPPSTSDRANLIVSIFGAVVGIILLIFGADLIGYPLILVAAFNLLLVYAFQDPPEPTSTEGAEYAQMVSQLDESRNILETLNAFLERQRRRVNQAQETVNQLREQKDALEPVVKTQRETVEAILTAHAVTMRTSIWKDRLVGFMLGILSSLIAAVLLFWSGVTL